MPLEHPKLKNAPRTICEHGIRKDKCKKCSVNTFCEHERTKVTCKECKGRYICTHMRRIFECRACSPHLFCMHKKKFIYCKLCDGSRLCPHANRRYQCPQCRNTPVCKKGKWANVELPPTVIPKAQTVIGKIRINYWNVIPPSLHKTTRKPKVLCPFNVPHPPAQGTCTARYSDITQSQSSKPPIVQFLQPRLTDHDDKMFFGDSLSDFTATQNTLDDDQTFDSSSDWPMLPVTAYSLGIDDM